jgi:hypothetical protein
LPLAGSTRRTASYPKLEGRLGKGTLLDVHQHATRAHRDLELPSIDPLSAWSSGSHGFLDMRYRSRNDAAQFSSDVAAFVNLLGPAEYLERLMRLGLGLNQKGHVTETDDRRNHCYRGQGGERVLALASRLGAY